MKLSLKYDHHHDEFFHDPWALGFTELLNHWGDSGGDFHMPDLEPTEDMLNDFLQKLKKFLETV